MVRRRNRANGKEPVLIVFVILMVSFFLFNVFNILFQVNVFSGKTAS